MARITTHVLDTAQGRPAAGLRVELFDGVGSKLGEGLTNGDGRLDQRHGNAPPDAKLVQPVYATRIQQFVGHAVKELAHEEDAGGGNYTRKDDAPVLRIVTKREATNAVAPNPGRDARRACTCLGFAAPAPGLSMPGRKLRCKPSYDWP